MRTNFLPLCMPAYRVHDVIMHSHLLRLSAAGAAPALQTVHTMERERRTTQDAIEMRWPSANRRRRLFVLCATSSGRVRVARLGRWIIWQAIHAVRGGMPLALVGHRRRRRRDRMGGGRNQQKQQQQQLQSTTISYCWQKFVKICIANF